MQELLCRTALETQKLELMSEVSNLKLKLNAMDKDGLDFDRFRDSEVCEPIHRTEILFVSAYVLSLSPHTRAHTPNRHSFMLSDTCVGEGLVLLSVSQQLCVEEGKKVK